MGDSSGRRPRSKRRDQKRYFIVIARGNGGDPIIGPPRRVPNEREKSTDRSALERTLHKKAADVGLLLIDYVVLDTRCIVLGRGTSRQIAAYIGRVKHTHALYLKDIYRGYGGRFEQRYRCGLFDQGQLLPQIARLLYWAPHLDGLVKDPGDWRWSGHRIYQRRSHLVGLRVDRLLQQFRGLRHERRAALDSYVSATPDDAVRMLWQCIEGLPLSRTIEFESELVYAQFGLGHVFRRHPPTLEELLRAVLADFGLPPSARWWEQDSAPRIRAEIYHHAGLLRIGSPHATAGFLSRSIRALHDWIKRNEHKEGGGTSLFAQNNTRRLLQWIGRARRRKLQCSRR